MKILTKFIQFTTGAVLLMLLLLYAIGFQVSENERAIVTRFGNPIRQIDSPGWHFRLPWPVESVRIFDARLFFQDLRLTESLTKDKRNIVVPLFVAWRIENPQRFLEALGSGEASERMIENMLTSAKNSVLGNVDFSQLVSVDPEKVALQSIEEVIRDRVRPIAAKEFGIGIEEVGIRRITLPEPNTPAVFERMRAERAQFASRFRAEGRRKADEIRVGAESEAALLLAEAQAYAETKRGETEAEIARTLAEAYAVNPALYRFLRQLETLRQVADEKTTLLLDASTPPFDLLIPEADMAPPYPSEAHP